MSEIFKKVEISSRLNIAGKVSERESSNRKYPVGNTERRKKKGKNVNTVLISCDTT